jgi:hypothetical protein
MPARPLPVPKTQKQLLIAQIADHIMTEYKPKTGPVVLMWREVMNGFHLKLNSDFPTWTRDDKRVHTDWKRNGPDVVRILRHYGLTVVKVNSKIRDLVKHGSPPDRGGKRTDARYRDCLPSSAHMVLGIVVFPRDTQTDHPLILKSNERRCRAMTSGLTNAIGEVRTANDLGVLSSEAQAEIIGDSQKIVRRAFDDNRYPLLEPPKATADAITK